MKKFLFLITLCLSVVLQLIGKSNEIIDLDPYEVVENSYVYWGFTSKYNFKSAFVPNFIDEISDIEISVVFKGGIADISGMQSGDKIIEINGRWNLNKDEMDQLFSSISVGEPISVKFQKPEGEQVTAKLEAIEYPKGENICFRAHGLSVTIKDADNWLDMSVRASPKFAKISYKKSPLLAIKVSDSPTFETLSDKSVHPIEKNTHIIFDSELNYRIE